jgi:glutamate formiminotransferase / 5-formyltetrahydrofolate cyclo-ligase
LQSRQPILMAVPNVSEGRDRARIDAIGAAFASAGGARLLDTHFDPDHGRSVFTLAARQGELARALVNGARAALDAIDLTHHAGAHPHVGAIDVAPVVYLDDARRGAACAEALTAAALIGDELELPVFLYGELAGGRERAEIRKGGPAELAARVRRGELTPEYGPPSLDPRRGALLMAARPPLVAFNVDLASDDVELAKRIAAEIRESGGGLPGVRAIGLQVRGRAQVSTNIHDYRAIPPALVLQRVNERAQVERVEVVGLAPRAALEGLPDGGFRTIEEALGSEALHGPDQEEAPA